jgi:pSer/pThr/pTyr-binding forkhead associated (FHA) protein
MSETAYLEIQVRRSSLEVACRFIEPIRAKSSRDQVYRLGLTDRFYTIGRSRDRHLAFLGSNKISKYHCCLQAVNGGHVLVDGDICGDKPSVNGIWVNGIVVPVSAALKSGDRIDFAIDRGVAGISVLYICPKVHIDRTLDLTYRGDH